MFSLSWQHLLVLFFLYFAVDTVRVTYRAGLRKIPGPFLARLTKFWRVQFVFDGKYPSKYHALHQEYGPIFRTGPNSVDISDPTVIPLIYGINSKFLKTLNLHIWQSKTQVLLTNLDISDGILRYDDTSLSRQPHAEHVLRQDPAYHKRLKESVAGKFSMTSIRTLEPYVDECTDIFLSEMRVRAGQAVDLSDWCQYYAFDVVGAITFQYRFGFMEQGKDVDGMMEGIWNILTYAGIIGQVPEFHPYLAGNQLLMKILERWGMLESDPFPKLMQITEARMSAYDTEQKSQLNRGDFLAWLRASQLKSPGRMTQRDLVNHLSNNLAADSDTTAISLRAVFYFLIQNPSCYAKQMAEIAAAEQAGRFAEKDHVSYEECLALPYLQAVMKEALRLHPGIGMPLERYVPDGGTNLCGVELPAGTVVGVNPHVVHRHKEIYGEDADEFKPERWIEAEPERLKVMERSFLAFGHGPRTCIGKNISIMEMGKLVPQVLRRFDLEWASEKPEWETSCFWMHKQKGLVVKFIEKEK